MAADVSASPHRPPQCHALHDGPVSGLAKGIHPDAAPSRAEHSGTEPRLTSLTVAGAAPALPG